KDSLRFEDGADAHGQGLVGHVFLAEEAVGGGPAGDRVQRRQSRPARAQRTRLVEADVSCQTNAKDLNVYPAGVVDPLLVRPALGLDLARSHFAVGNMRV